MLEEENEFHYSISQMPTNMDTIVSVSFLSILFIVSTSTSPPQHSLSLSLRSSSHGLFRTLSSSSSFVSDHWGKSPLYIPAADVPAATKLAKFFTIKNLLEASGSFVNGYRTSDEYRQGDTTTWKFVPLNPNPIKPISEEMIRSGLEGGTIYFNSAGSLWKNLGEVCCEAIDAFDFPCNINVYCTPKGFVNSVPPHTDQQHVFVLQTNGQKHWKVYAPPPTRTTKGSPSADPLMRGKGGDILKEEECGELLFEGVVREGDVLYIPCGFPHVTSTSESKKESVHMTLGVDATVFGLTWAHLRFCVLSRLNLDTKIDNVSDDHFWMLQRALPIGFLSGDSVDDIVSQFHHLCSTVDAKKYKRMIGKINREAIVGSLETLQEHAKEIINVQRRSYEDVDIRSDDSLIKAAECTRSIDELMLKFATFARSFELQRKYRGRIKHYENMLDRESSSSNRLQ